MKTKVDYFGIADETAVVVVGDDQGASASTVEAKGQDGSVVAVEVFGQKIAPSCDYKMKGQWKVLEGSEKKLGHVVTTNEKSVVLTELSISTSNGDIPDISAKGEQAEAGASDGCVYKIPAFTLEKKSHAQILWEAFTVTGSGCHLQSASYSASCSFVTSEKDGAVLAFDVTEGKIECDAEILQVGESEPVVTEGSGWTVTSPLSRTNPDSNNPTWKFKLVKYLEKA